MRDGSSSNTPESMVDMMLPERFLTEDKLDTNKLALPQRVQDFYGINESVSYSLVRLVSPWNMSAVRQPMRLLERSLKV